MFVQCWANVVFASIRPSKLAYQSQIDHNNNIKTLKWWLFPIRVCDCVTIFFVLEIVFDKLFFSFNSY